MSNTTSPLRIHSSVAESIVDGPGIRTVIFTQGCPHHCPGCHNPQTHDFDGGFLVDPQAIIAEILAMKNEGKSAAKIQLELDAKGLTVDESTVWQFLKKQQEKYGLI